MLSFARLPRRTAPALTDGPPTFKVSLFPRLLRLLAVTAFAGLTGVSPAYPAANDPVALNFVNAEIESVVRAVGEILGRNFVIDPKVKGVVNIVSARPVPRSLIYPTLLAALRMQGFTVVESGGITRIVPEGDAKQQPTPVGVGNPAPLAGERLVTQVYLLQHESAAQIANVLRPLMTPNSTVSAFPAANALILTDYADNLRRIGRIVDTLDQPPGTEPAVIPLRNASAVDVAQLVTRLMADASAPTQAGAATEPAQRYSVLAEPRSNSVLVRADSPVRLGRIRNLIAQLDGPAGAGSNIRIVYLRNADAVKVAQILRSVLTGSDPPATAAAGSLAAPAGSPASAPLAAASAATSSVTVAAAGASITADPGTNALIINAAEPVYNNLRAVIEKLDVRRAQVYVEALIAEVTSERAAEFGVQWQILDRTSLGDGYSGTGRVGGGTNFGDRGTGRNIIDLSTNLGSAASGLNIGIFRGQVSIPGVGTIANLGLLARALEADAKANILSIPNLLTLDNEEARVVIGQNVPFLTGSFAQGTTTTGAINPFQTFERKDVGLTLRVKPQITEGGSVRLAIYQEVSSVQDRNTNGGGIITNKRALESTVLVDDGQIIVLGGLLQDSLSDGTDKVPLLGDVPIVGNLFRYDTRKRAKTNLMVFLRPTVIRGPDAGKALTLDRYELLLGEQRRQAPDERFFWNDPSVPVLPPAESVPGRR